MQRKGWSTWIFLACCLLGSPQLWAVGERPDSLNRSYCQVAFSTNILIDREGGPWEGGGPFETSVAIQYGPTNPGNPRDLAIRLGS